MSTFSQRPIKLQLNVGENRIRVIGKIQGSHLAYQRGDLCLWTTQTAPHRDGLESPDQDNTTQYRIYVALTGETLPASASGWEYLDTALSGDGSFVVHAYRAVE